LPFLIAAVARLAVAAIRANHLGGQESCQSLNRTMDDVEAASAATPVQVKFTGITLDVKTGKDQTKRILDDVSGHFGPAESVAVMGVGPRRFTPAM
tara:strand:+ start:160 stop:447 length:288 start_codon:yes stop_codon:yes gene_type:complete